MNFPSFYSQDFEPHKTDVVREKLQATPHSGCKRNPRMFTSFGSPITLPDKLGQPRLTEWGCAKSVINGYTFVLVNSVQM